MPKERKTRSPEELIEASSHLHYELRQMCGQTVTHYHELDKAEAKKEQEQNQKHDGDDFVRNATLEGALVHCRSLVHFLGWDRGKAGAREDDVIWEDYSPESAPSSRRPRALAEDFKTNVDKWIGHLTYTRRDDPKVTWELVRIAVAVRDEMKRVMDSVPAELLSAKWLDERARLAPPRTLDPLDQLHARADRASQGVATGTLRGEHLRNDVERRFHGPEAYVIVALSSRLSFGHLAVRTQHAPAVPTCRMSAETLPVG